MIHLVTDSTAYLPDDIKEKYGIHTVSLKINVGDKTYDEEGGITKDEFYKLLADVATAPTTSQPSAGEFLEMYQKLLGEEDEVISIHISEALSGTVPNARAAAQEFGPDRLTKLRTPPPQARSSPAPTRLSLPPAHSTRPTHTPPLAPGPPCESARA